MGETGLYAANLASVLAGAGVTRGGLKCLGAFTFLVLGQVALFAHDHLGWRPETCGGKINLGTNSEPIMPPPNLPVVDPDSDLGRRLFGRQQREGAAPVVANQIPLGPGLWKYDGAGGPVGERGMGAGIFGALNADLRNLPDEPPPAALLEANQPKPAGPSEPPMPAGPVRTDLPPPSDEMMRSLAAGAGVGAMNAAGNFTPVPTQDPFRLFDPGLGRTPGRQVGDVFRLDQNDPRMRNPFLYDDGGTMRSSTQRGAMGPDGFTPGFMTTGVGGQQVWADSPQTGLMAIQQAAAAQGLNPGQFAAQFLDTLNNSAQRATQAGIAAQGVNARLMGDQIGAEAQRDVARTNAEGAARSAAFNALGQFVAGLPNLPPGAAAVVAPYFNRAFGGGAWAPPPGVQPPGATPSLPGDPAAAGLPAPHPAMMQAGPGTDLASLASGNDALRGYRDIFGTTNAQGVFTPFQASGEGVASMDQRAQQLLDRAGANRASDADLRRLIAEIDRGGLGNQDLIKDAIRRQTAIATMRLQNGLPVGQGGPLDNITNAFRNSHVGQWLGMDPVAPQAVVDPDTGNTLFTVGTDPAQSSLAAGLATLFTRVPYNRAVFDGRPVTFNRADVNTPFNRAKNTPEQNRMRATEGQRLTRLFQENPHPSQPR